MLVKKRKLFICSVNIINKNNISINLIYGNIGLKVLEGGYLTPQQLEASRRILAKHLKKKTGQLWMRGFSLMPKTKKPKEVRMGKGKGPIKGTYLNICAGSILFELAGLSVALSIYLLNLVMKKLSLKCTILLRFTD